MYVTNTPITTTDSYQDENNNGNAELRSNMAFIGAVVAVVVFFLVGLIIAKLYENRFVIASVLCAVWKWGVARIWTNGKETTSTDMELGFVDVVCQAAVLSKAKKLLNDHIDYLILKLNHCRKINTNAMSIITKRSTSSNLALLVKCKRSIDFIMHHNFNLRYKLIVDSQTELLEAVDRQIFAMNHLKQHAVHFVNPKFLNDVLDDLRVIGMKLYGNDFYARTVSIWEKAAELDHHIEAHLQCHPHQ